ncbi:MAG TPA: hypothetical protein VI911_08840 [Patescibacteria group bacterium]|nr:MAG: hypothetical protein UR43_C0005G0064 [candidate division TM6 bacterium GW2011_GWF2_33_332]HLD91103.1 hypothetical protein [Patescibacteria group bacterium]
MDLESKSNEEIQQLSQEVGKKVAKMLKLLVTRVNKLLKMSGLPLKVKLQYQFEKIDE